MDVKQILKLNEEFYQSVAKDFSRTRQKPWEGWGRVIENIKKYFGTGQSPQPYGRIKVLDLGCGNGRFFNFLNENLSNVVYTGIDINNDLLGDFRTQSGTRSKIGSNLRARPCTGPGPVFLTHDIISDMDKVSGKFDIVVAFGLTHHIPGDSFRKRWFKKLPKLLSSAKSLLVLSFWEFEKKPGDYLVSWGNKSETPRYCHKYSKREINEIVRYCKSQKLKLIDKYKADNKNLYLVFGKI